MYGLPICQRIYNRSLFPLELPSHSLDLPKRHWCTFILETHRKEALEKFHPDFNFQPSSKLTLEYSTQQISFLNTAMKVCSGHITITLCQKSTDCHNYLHATSCHPKHTTGFVIYSQALCYNLSALIPLIRIHILCIWNKDS